MVSVADAGDDDRMSLIDDVGWDWGDAVPPDEPPQAAAPRPTTSRAAAVLAARGRDSMNFLQNGSGFTDRSTAEPDPDRLFAGLIRIEPDDELPPVSARRARVQDSGRVGSTAVDDAALIARVNAGDEAAIEALYARYGGPCFGLARRILDDAQLAEDVVQQVFLALWKGTGFDPKRGAVSTWLMSMTHHKAVDSLRRESTRRKRLAGEQALLELRALGPGPEDEAWARLRAERTRDALRLLPSEQREVLLLAYYGGYTQREIADLTGLPLGTVKSRTLAAMRRLREQLSGVAGPGEGVEP